MDPVALGALATTAVSFILPYLGKTGEAFSEKAGEKLFEFLQALEKKPAASEALGALEKSPQETRGTMRSSLARSSETSALERTDFKWRQRSPERVLQSFARPTR
jgi:hypothetical protein